MTLYGAGVKIANFNGYDIQNGDYYLNYNTNNKIINSVKYNTSTNNSD